MLKLRRAIEADSKMLFEWANDPVTRANSATTDPIPWEAHSEWFSGKLNDRDSLIFLALDDDEPVGVVRFDASGEEAEISVNLAPDARGRGLGSVIIRLGCAEVGTTVVAYIREENVASQKAFQAAGFEADGRRVVRGVDMLRFIKAR